MNSLIFFFSSLGVFNGILLSLYLFIFAKEKSLAKYFLGALVLALSIRIGKSILIYFDPSVSNVYRQIGLSACVFIGPLLYYYLKTVIDEVKVIPKEWKWVLLSILVGIVTVGAIRSYPTHPDFWNVYAVKSIYVVWLLGICAGAMILIPYLYKRLRTSEGLSSLDKWLSVIFLANVIIATAFFLALFGFSEASYITGPLVFTFFLYLLAYGYFNDQWFDTTSDHQPLEKYRNKKIDHVEANQIMQSLNDLMIQKRMYANPGLKLKDVADHLNITTHQLSQLLNDNIGKGFKPFINEHRINAACDLLGTDHQLSLEGIGYEVGFRSKSTFFTSFKKLKNTTPAKFQEGLSPK